MEVNGVDQTETEKPLEATAGKPGKTAESNKPVDSTAAESPANLESDARSTESGPSAKSLVLEDEDRGQELTSKKKTQAEIAISVKNLKKDFYISHSGVASLKSHLLKLNKQEPIERLQVLKGISFDVRKGECVAVVGRNGAGKSTLLSLLSRIYLPTTGSVEIRGRMAPLLELGGGFHPDLTGYENIFVNGMILGISHDELVERVDEIVEFSELSSHIDSPVRTYSSGMNARLGFSIVVHVDAEVLLLDEVLAVGDYSFREKCAKKIDAMRAEGKTILLVSHSGSDVERLADRAIWIQGGLIRAEGSPKKVLRAYTKSSSSELVTAEDKYADAKFEYVYYEDDDEPEKPASPKPANPAGVGPTAPATLPLKLPEIPPARSPGMPGVPIFQWSDQGFGILNMPSSDTASGPFNRASINLGAKNYPFARGDTIASFNATTWGSGVPKPTGAIVFSNAEPGPQSAGNLGASFSIGLCESGTDAIKARFIIRHNGDVLLSGAPLPSRRIRQEDSFSNRACPQPRKGPRLPAQAPPLTSTTPVTTSCGATTNRGGRCRQTRCSRPSRPMEL